MPRGGTWTDHSDGMRHARNKQKWFLFSSQNTGEGPQADLGPEQISALGFVSTRKGDSLPEDRCTPICKIPGKCGERFPGTLHPAAGLRTLL